MAVPDWVLDETFDLFAALDATEEQLEFPVLYASSKQGWATDELEDERADMAPLFRQNHRARPGTQRGQRR